MEPATSKRHLGIAASGYVVNVLLTGAIQHINARAPLITFELVSLNEQLIPALNSGQLDPLVIPEHYLQKDQRSQALFAEDHVCVVGETTC